MSLPKYLDLFAHLRTDKNQNRWTQATMFRAPHKPLLLLSILDLFSQGVIHTNLIEITPELGDLFARYWSILMPIDRHGNMALPFFHLASSSFWHLLPVPGQETILEATHQVDTLSQLQKLILGAKLDDDLYQLIQTDEARNALRTVIIQTYFTPDLHTALLYQGSINQKSFIYSQELIKRVLHHTYETPGDENKYEEATRDQGFRKAVMRLYDHRCAFCGVRMLTVDGHSAVDAAHIIPWSTSHNDDPRNGMALCRLCHWTFDEGLSSVSSQYTVLLSADIRNTQNMAGHLLNVENRQIIAPSETAFWPDHGSLAWHRKNIYIGTL